jgi:trehalose/maltose transport system substrate-binding protein
VFDSSRFRPYGCPSVLGFDFGHIFINDVRSFLSARYGWEKTIPARFISRRLFPRNRTLRSFLIFAVIVRLCGSLLPIRASAQGTVLTVAGFSQQSSEALSREGLDAFMRANGIRVEFIPSWGNSTDQLGLILRTLNGHFRTPDVYLIDVVWPGSLQKNLLDLTPYLNADARGQLPEILMNDTINGRLVSLPLYMNVGLLYYRTDLLKKYGYHEPPRTWDELQRMAARIQRGERAAGHSSFWGYVWQGDAYEGLTCNALEWQSSFGGGRIIGPGGVVTVNNPRTLEALRTATSWVGSISPPSVLSYTEADSLNVFRSGNAAFLRYWSSGYHSNRAPDSAVRDRFSVTLLPAGAEGHAQVVGGFQLAVSRYSAHPQKAAELVLFLTGSNAQKSRALQEGYLPTRSRLYRDVQVLEAVPEARIVSEAKPESWVLRPASIAGPGYSAISKCYFETVHSILARQCSPEKGLRDLQQKLTDSKQSFAASR